MIKAIFCNFQQGIASLQTSEFVIWQKIDCDVIISDYGAPGYLTKSWLRCAISAREYLIVTIILKGFMTGKLEFSKVCLASSTIIWDWS